MAPLPQGRQRRDGTPGLATDRTSKTMEEKTKLSVYLASKPTMIDKASAWWPLWHHMNQEHHLVLLDSECAEIADRVRECEAQESNLEREKQWHQLAEVFRLASIISNRQKINEVHALAEQIAHAAMVGMKAGNPSQNDVDQVKYAWQCETHGSWTDYVI